MEQKLDLILSELQNLNKRIGHIETEFQTVKSQLDENTQLTKAIFHRQEETDAQLDAISMDVHKLHGEMSGIKEAQDIIIHGQERQDKILESLALRSLEQETELRELKRIK